jgi:hypothetical protein
MKNVYLVCFCLLTSLFGFAQQSVLISPNGAEAIKFNNTVTEKITFWDNGQASKYGIGISSGEYRFYVPTAFDDFVFGVGSNSTFVEKFRLKGNGSILSKAPILLLDGGGSGRGAGIWFYSNGNTGFNTFLGINSTNKFGIYSPFLAKNVFSADMATGGIRLDGPNMSSPQTNMLSLGGFGKLEIDGSGTPGGRMSILENGNVGIGTNSPNALLEVSSNAINNPLRINGSNGLYITTLENNVPRGYFGSFYGNPEDVDFGTL